MKKLFTFLCLAAGMHCSAQTVAGGDMETWVSYSSSGTPLTRPANWFSSDSLIRFGYTVAAPGTGFAQRCFKTTTVTHGGTSAAMLVTSANDTLPSILANSNISFNLADILAGKFIFKYKGGTNVTKRISYVHAWAQYKTVTADKGRMNVMAIKNGIGAGGADSTIGSGYLDINPFTPYADVTVAINYKDATTIPDRLVISFLASIRTMAPAGDTLYVDDVRISDPTGIETSLMPNPNFNVYPNPANNVLHISSAFSENLQVAVYDQLGKLQMRSQMQQSADVDITKLASGRYTCVFMNEQGEKLHTTGFVKL